MKRFCLFIVPILMISCSGEEASSDSNSSEESQSEELSQEENWEEEDEEAVGIADWENENYYTAKAMLDGPDEWFYVIDPEGELPEFEVLHIIPDNSYGNNEGKQLWMVKIMEEDFKLYEPYDQHTGLVRVFYDEYKTYEMTSFQTSNGKVNGEVDLRNTNGETIIKREYSVGKWVSSEKELASVNWSFRQDESHLMINDPEFGIEKHDDGSRTVNLLQSMLYDQHKDNNLYRIIEKASFGLPFKVNDEVMNGELYAFLPPKHPILDTYYILRFKDGYLDGEIMIYNDWGELELHERFEDGELVETIYQLEYGDGVAKPIIYLYPEKEQVVSVELDFDGRLTHTYPAYPNNGWKVLAKPDGTLFDEKGKEYYALYWEGQEREEFTIDEGFVVPGDQSAEFLEKSLDILGLSRREANEFIVYWLPKLENNPYNLIHFSSDQYEEMAELKITPTPETLIRVMMVYQPLELPIDLPQQNLYDLRKERKGFTVVEWGGAELRQKRSGGAGLLF